jgi:hypothetical protein
MANGTVTKPIVDFENNLCTRNIDPALPVYFVLDDFYDI